MALMLLPRPLPASSFFFISLLVLSSLACSAFGATVNWKSASSGYWTDFKWDISITSCCPTSSDDTYITVGTAGSSYTVTVAVSNADTKSLTMGTNSASSGPAPTMNLGRDLTMSSGALTLYYRSKIDVLISGGISCPAASYINLYGGTIDITADSTIDRCSVRIASAGSFIVSAGRVTFSGGTTRNIEIESGGLLNIGDAIFDATATTAFACYGTITTASASTLSSLLVTGTTTFYPTCNWITGVFSLNEFRGTNSFQSNLTLQGTSIVRTYGTTDFYADVLISDFSGLQVNGVTTLHSNMVMRLNSSAVLIYDDFIMRGPNCKLHILNLASVNALFANFNVSGAEIRVVGTLLANGGTGQLFYATNSNFILEQAWFYMSSAYFENGVNVVAYKESIIGMMPVVRFHNCSFVGYEDSEIRFQRKSLSDNTPAVITKSLIELWDSSRISTDAPLHVFDESILAIHRSAFIAGDGLMVCNRSKVIVAGEKAEFQIQTNGLILCDESRVIVTNYGSVVITDSAYGFDYDAMKDLINTSPSLSPNVETDASSYVLLENGGMLLGVGVINGIVRNVGGRITFRNSSVASLIYIDQYTQTDNGTLDTSIVQDPQTGEMRSATAVVTRNATLGGNVSVMLNSSLDQSIRNGTSQQDMRPGIGGIMLVNSTQSMTGTLPFLDMQTYDTSSTIVQQPAECGYGLEQRGTSLFLIFDTQICTPEPPGSPGGSSIAPGEAGLGSNSVGGLPGWGIALIILIFIALTAGVILVIKFVPSVRRLVFKMDAAEYEMSKKVKEEKVRQEEEKKLNVAQESSSPAAEPRKAGWSRGSSKVSTLKNTQ